MRIWMNQNKNKMNKKILETMNFPGFTRVVSGRFGEDFFIHIASYPQI